MPEGGSNVSSIAKTSALREGGCTFRFEILRPGELNPDIETDITFPAFIESIEDSFSPTWGTFNDMGRGDPKVMLQSFSRGINITFKVVALEQPGTGNSPEELYRKLNQLTTAVTPHYVDDVGFVGRFVRFSIAKLWIKEYGYIDSLNMSIDSSTPWRATREGRGEWPMVTTVQMGIKWIGEKRPDAGNINSYNTDVIGDRYTMAELRPTEPVPPLPPNPIEPLPSAPLQIP